MDTYKRTALAASFLACIIGANYATSHLGLVPVGFGLTATAGTYFAGLSFVLRDALQDAAGKTWTFGTIAAGAVLSLVLAEPMIALASCVAFAVSETVDSLVYTPLRSKGYVRAAVASNVASSIVDTVAFLAIAGFPIWAALPGQVLAKTAITVTVVAGVVIARAVSRQPLRRPESA